MNKATVLKAEVNEEMKTTLEHQLKSDISLWLLMYLEKVLNLAKDDIDIKETFSSFGMDSSAAIGLTGDLGQWLEFDIDPATIYDNPSIETLTEFLSKEEGVQIKYASKKEAITV